MRHEVIKLTDAAIYPELIKLLESKGEPIYHSTKTPNPKRFAIGFDSQMWVSCEGFNGITITDVDFLQKYGENTAQYEFHTTEKEKEMQMNNPTYQQAIEWASEWMHQNHPDVETIEDGIWANEFVEYDVFVGDFECVRFRKEGIEIRSSVHYNFIIPPTKDDFFTVLRILDK